MVCRSCGHEIAANAIVCYKCGTPTALPAPVSRPQQPAARRPRWVAIPVILILIALGVWAIPLTEPGSYARWASWAALVVAAAATAVFFVRRR